MILISMAGQSRRFREKGYGLPKHLLPLQGRTVFYWALMSLEKYFNIERILFVTLESNNDAVFIKETCKLLELSNFRIIALKAPTAGQAETIRSVTTLLSSAEKADQLNIFNIDTLRPDLSFPIMTEESGWLELFRGEGDHWSFAKLSDNHPRGVLRIAEKNRISDWCSTGAYAFSSVSFFEENFDITYGESWIGDEKYVAPILQTAITRGFAVDYSIIENEQMIPAGTPPEYISCNELNLERLFLKVE